MFCITFFFRSKRIIPTKEQSIKLNENISQLKDECNSASSKLSRNSFTDNQCVDVSETWSKQNQNVYATSLPPKNTVLDLA